MLDLLYEIGCEEIPSSYIEPALGQLETALRSALDDAGLAYHSVCTAGTPRRLVLSAAALAEGQPDTEEDILGPPAKAAFDADGHPTKAAHGFARSQGVEVSEIQLRDTPQGKYCCVRKQVKGRSTMEILAEALPSITLDLSFPKSMVWPGSGRTFARPVRYLVALLGERVIEFSVLGIETGRTTELHPFLSAGTAKIETADYETYKATLRAGSVMVDLAERRQAILDLIERALAGKGRIAPEATAWLVDDVTNLVQSPSVTPARFDREFLKLPDAVIKAAMMEHQRYFPVTDDQGKLLPHFIVVSDRGAEPSDEIRAGNEAVLRARLADARFFDEQDRKTPLPALVDRLNSVAFLKGLGTYADKARRLEKLARIVADALSLGDEAADYAARAALLCKADLLTEMVGEFPKLQGDVGRIYALRDGEPEPVAAAIHEHYLPRSADGALPRTPAGQALSLAEKLDNLVGCFALGLTPTGSADPYALRRQSQAAVRIIEAIGAHVDFAELARAALALLPEPHAGSEEALPKLLDFVRDRLFQFCLDRGAPHDLIHAALVVGFRDVVDFRMRLDALRELSSRACWQDLVTAVERTHNISRNAPPTVQINPALFSEPLEKKLWSLYEAHQQKIERLEDERRYVEASQRYAEVFAGPLHRFFDNVFVNVDDEKVRHNRLWLLRAINRLYSARIADLSQIVTGVEK